MTFRLLILILAFFQIGCAQEPSEDTRYRWDFQRLSVKGDLVLTEYGIGDNTGVNYVYLSPNGNDSIAEINNPYKPFNNIDSAIQAVDPNKTQVVFKFYYGDYTIDLQGLAKTLNPFDTTIWISDGGTIRIEDFHQSLGCFNDAIDYVDGNRETRLFVFDGPTTRFEFGDFSTNLPVLNFFDSSSKVYFNAHEIIGDSNNFSRQYFATFHGGDITIKADKAKINGDRFFNMVGVSGTYFDRSVNIDIGHFIADNSLNSPNFWIGGSGSGYIENFDVRINIGIFESIDAGSGFSDFFSANLVGIKNSNFTINVDQIQWLKETGGSSAPSLIMFKAKSTSEGGNNILINIGNIYSTYEKIIDVLTVTGKMINDNYCAKIGSINCHSLDKVFHYDDESGHQSITNSTLSVDVGDINIHYRGAKGIFDMVDNIAIDSSVINMNFGNVKITERNNVLGNSGNGSSVNVDATLTNHSVFNIHFDYLYVNQTDFIDPLGALDFTIDSLDKSIVMVSGTYITEFDDGFDIRGNCSKKIFFKDCTIVVPETGDCITSASNTDVLIQNCYSNKAPNVNITELVDSVVVSTDLKYLK